MGKLKTWIQGYVEVCVRGNHPERFITLMHNKGIIVWDMEPKDDSYVFKMKRGNFKQLDAIRKKTGSQLEITGKYGLPFWLFRYRKRKFFLLSLVLTGVMVYVCSCFVWDINVEGTYYYTDEQIKTCIENNYVQLGQRKSEIDCNWLEERLREEFPELSWVSCELIGTQLNVMIKETLEGTETVTEDTPIQDIVAAKDAVIVEMITRNGTPVASVGQTVSKGDIVISGVINIYNDFDEVLETDYVAADGDVIGETVYHYDDSFEIQYYRKEYTGAHQSAFTVEIVNWVQDIHLPWREFANFDVVEENHKLRLGHTYYLPFSFTILERREYKPILVSYTEEEAIQRAEERLQRYIDNLSEKEVEIIENHVTIECRDGICRAEGSLVVWERIGYGRELCLTPAPQEEVPTD